MSRVIGRLAQSRKKPKVKSKKKVKTKKIVSITAKPRKKADAPKVAKGSQWEEYRKGCLLRRLEIIGLQNFLGERRAICRVIFQGNPTVTARSVVKIACRRLQERFKHIAN